VFGVFGVFGRNLAVDFGSHMTLPRDPVISYVGRAPNTRVDSRSAARLEVVGSKPRRCHADETSRLKGVFAT
jgi:hypothetical protein